MTAIIERPISPPSEPIRRGAHFRTDIEGLRSFAILGVVLFHASVPYFDGGYVGVDVFFVISGFLITGALVREAESTQRIRLGAFYARRAKRLLPPAAIVITATIVAAWFVAPLLTVFSASFDLLWSIFYAANWRFIAQGNDYLGGASDYNVALHFWSLAVEEQFYLFWPAVIILATWLSRRKAWSAKTVVTVLMTLVTAVSLGLCVWLTYTDPSLAYMATYTRAWQFGVGALIAVWMPNGAKGRWLLPIGWLGLVAVCYSIVVLTSATRYPGWAALIPTLGTGMVLGSSAIGLRRVLSIRPLRAIGRWSYPWYLWHWPILVLAEIKYPDLSWRAKSLLMGGALVLAAVTHRFVEAPIMGAGQLKRHVQSAAAVGLIATVFAAASVFTVGTQVVHALGSANTSAPPAVSFKDVFGTDANEDSGAVFPAPINAHADIPRHAECLLDRDSVQPECKFGVEGGRKVVLFGDSHAQQWSDAVEEIANKRGWELTILTMSGCPVPAIKPRENETARFSQGYCRDWRDKQINRINEIAPALVIFSSLSNYIPQLDELFSDWAASLDRIKSSGAELVYIRDTPFPVKNVPECVSSALDNWSKCAFRMRDAVDPVIAGGLQGKLPHADVLDLNGYLCDGDICPAVRNKMLLYRDDSHLTNTAAKALTPAIEIALTQQGVH